MDKIAQYRQYVQALLSQYASQDSSDDQVEVQLILDPERDHYQWMNVGWQQFNRIYRCILHIDIKDKKIWIQQNLTDQNPAEELIKMGVLREDIVLGLQPPYKRPYTNYGVA
ncbi:MAG: XisI protein [Phormidesmis sp. CAN_BIN44]|nr:XisI protein [Phormidesmis sp. CAN_BIN44]